MISFFKKKEYKLTPIQELLLALLRAQLWLKPVDDIVLPSTSEEWDELINHGYKQTVICFIAKACLRHPDAENIPTEIKEEFEAVLEENKRIHEHHNAVLIDLITKFEEQGIHPILLKGQGLAQLFPEPELRQCGDIDLFVGLDKYPKALQVMQSFEDDNFVTKESVHHYHTCYKGIDVDLHRRLGKLQNPFQDKRFQKWTVDNYVTNYKETSELINGEKVLVPSITANACELFRHLYGHLITRGIGLRQLVDFAMFLHVNHKNIESHVLQDSLRSIGEFKAWQIIINIIYHFLGLEKTECPLLSVKYYSDAVGYSQSIIEDGNLGKDKYFEKSIFPKGYLGACRGLEIYLRKMSYALSWMTKDFNNSFWMAVRYTLHFLRVD